MNKTSKETIKMDEKNESNDNYSALMNDRKALSSFWRENDKNKSKKKGKSKKTKRKSGYSSTSTNESY